MMYICRGNRHNPFLVDPILFADSGSGNEKLIIFATDANMKMLCEPDIMYVNYLSNMQYYN